MPCRVRGLPQCCSLCCDAVPAWYTAAYMATCQSDDLCLQLCLSLRVRVGNSPHHTTSTACSPDGHCCDVQPHACLQQSSCIRVCLLMCHRNVTR